MSTEFSSDSTQAAAKNTPASNARSGAPAGADGKIDVAELALTEMVELNEKLGKWGAPNSRLGDGMRAQEFDLELRRPGGEFFVARSGGKLVGAVAAGSLGLRGVVRALWFDDTAPVTGVAWLLLRAALHEFEAARILRVLVFPGSSSDWESEVWRSWGFARPEAARLLTCHVMDTRETPKSPPGVIIRPFLKSEADAVSLALGRASEPGFEQWERHLLESAPLGRNRAFFVAWRDAEPVGVLIGGTFGELASVTHLWVCEQERAAGVGQQLMGHALLAFTRAEAKHVHVILSSAYLASAPFWAALGFRESSSSGFFERTLKE